MRMQFFIDFVRQLPIECLPQHCLAVTRDPAKAVVDPGLGANGDQSAPKAGRIPSGVVAGHGLGPPRGCSGRALVPAQTKAMQQRQEKDKATSSNDLPRDPWDSGWRLCRHMEGQQLDLFVDSLQQCQWLADQSQDQGLNALDSLLLTEEEQAERLLVIHQQQEFLCSLVVLTAEGARRCKILAEESDDAAALLVEAARIGELMRRNKPADVLTVPFCMPRVSFVYGDVSPDFTPNSSECVVPHAYRGDPEEHAVPPYFLCKPWPVGFSGWVRDRLRRQGFGAVAWRTQYATGHYTKVIRAREGDIFFSLVAPIDENRPGYFVSGDVDLDVVHGFCAGGCVYQLTRLPNRFYCGREFQMAVVGVARDSEFGLTQLLPGWRYHVRKFQRWAMLPTPQVLRFYVDNLKAPTTVETIKARWNLVIRCAPEEHKATLRSWRIAAVEKEDMGDPIAMADGLLAAEAATRLARGQGTRTRC